jgi:hypothetical protein
MAILDNFPIWAIYLGGVALLVLIAEIGYRTGIWMRERNPNMEKNRVTNSLVGGLMALMAFVMALTIGTVINQHSGRKTMVVTEVNVIRTAFLRAGFLDEPDRISTRELLQEYAEVRLRGAENPEQLEYAITRSEEIHDQLWPIVEENVLQGKESDTMALFVDAINEMINIHTLRVTAHHRRLPSTYGVLLMMATFVSFLMIGIASSADKRRAYTPIILYALAFMAVFLIVVDLDRPVEGSVTVSQQAMRDLVQWIMAY